MEVLTGSFTEMQMNLENVTETEVSQKEKNIYCLLMHICGVQKNGMDEPVYKVEIDRENKWIDTKGEGGG